MANKKTRLTLDLQLTPDLAAPVARLEKLLGFTQGKGICVSAVQGDRNGVTLKDGKAVIYYTKKNVFYRELGVLCEHARKKDAFEIFEDTHFETLSVMIDTSRCGVPKVATIERMIDHLAVMGYSMIMLYTEDTLTIEGRPYFGYMRGRYTPEQLRAVDDYAFEYGIEAIPCLECYGHMNRYLIWPEAKPIKDTKIVLLAREEETFEFVEQLIVAASSCFRSKRIHIGMDEAWDMGRGKFMDKHGYVPPTQIFSEYMERLIAITRKHGLTPMMWSDMYYRASGMPYGGEPDNYLLPQHVVDEIPEGVELVYWHYGERPYTDEIALCSHKATGHKTIYAGGLWSWIGHFPEHNYAMETIRFSLNACRKNDVREAMITIWTNDNAECDWFANLFGLSFFAELCYDKDASEEKLDERFAATTGGGNRKAFYTMSLYHDNFDDLARHEKWSHRFLGKPMFWQDVLEGLYDTHLFAYPMSGHYAACADKMQAFAAENKESKWHYLYDFAYRVFTYLATKTQIAERLQPAYLAGDKAALAELAGTLLPLLKEKVQAVHKAHKAIWMAHNNMIGWCNLDIRYAGVAARCDTAIELINAYLAGEIPAIESLAETRLEKRVGGFSHYSDMATPNEKT